MINIPNIDKRTACSHITARGNRGSGVL